MSLNVDNALIRETQGLLSKIYREFSGALCTAEYCAPYDASVGDDCLLRTFIYDGNNVVGETTEASTWTQDMQDVLDGISTPFTYSYCTSFDGVNDNCLGTHTADTNFERTDAFSVSAWFKTSSATEQTIVAKQDVTTNFRGWRLYVLSSGAVGLELSNSNTGTTRITKSTNSSYRTGNWVHVCATFNGVGATGIDIYINGALATSSSSGTIAATIQNTVAVRVGSRENADTYFNGRIDEVAIWDKQLTSSEASKTHDSTYKNYNEDHPAAASLINWWRMGDGDTYPTLTDRSEGGFIAMNLTMTNMTSGNLVLDVGA